MKRNNPPITAQIITGHEIGSKRKIAVLAVTKMSGTVELPFKKVVTPTANTPINTAFIPRVIIKGFIPNKPIAKPLIEPITKQYKNAQKSAISNPSDDLTLTINAAPAAIIAKDKSIPPVSIQIVCPAANKPSGAARSKVVPIDGIEKKYGSIKLVTKKRAINIPNKVQIDFETLAVA